MKTKSFLLSVLAFLAIATSCNKNVDPMPDPENGQPALLEIKLADSDVNLTRAVGAPSQVTETSITTGVIFVFKGTGADPALDAKKTFDFTGTNVATVKVDITQGIRQIYVVANVNVSDFNTINNLSDLQHITNKLSLAAFRTHGSLPVSGFLNNVNAVGATSQNPLAVTIPLNFIGSRVHVDWDVTNLNSGLVGLTMTGAAILNVNSSSEYIAVPNGSGGYSPLTHGLYNFLQGVGDVSLFTGSYSPSVGTQVPTTNAYDVELSIAAANKGFDQNYTYVFENSSPKPIIVAFKATYNNKTYYWPVVINGALNGIGGANNGNQTASVARATIYKVKAVIKGLGNEDPYAPINPGVIEVSVTPASWLATVNIDQEF